MKAYLEKLFAAQIAEIKENKDEFSSPDLVDYALEEVFKQMDRSIKNKKDLIIFLTKNSLLMAAFILEEMEDFEG